MSLSKGSVTQYRFHCHLIGPDDKGPHTPGCPHTCHWLQDLTQHPAGDYKAFNTLKGLNNVGTFSSDIPSIHLFRFSFSCACGKNICNCTHTHTNWSGNKKRSETSVSQPPPLPPSWQTDGENCWSVLTIKGLMKDKILNLTLHHLQQIGNVSIYKEAI